MKITYHVNEENKLIDILRQELGISSRLIRKLKKDKSVMVNKIVISMNAILRVGDQIEVILPTEENIFEPEDIPIEVIHEDDHFLIIDKQPFVVVHPTRGHPFGTIANGVARYMIDKKESYKIRFANRLDRDTSGVMILCKSGYGQKIVSDQMNDNSIIKEYDAIVEGVVANDQGTINEPIGRAFEDSVHRVVRPDGMPSVTHYKVMARMKNKTWLRVRLETGRTHQIRVHLKHLGHVILGDELYGGNHQWIDRQALHACHLKFKNTEGHELDVHAQMPEDMRRLLEEHEIY